MSRAACIAACIAALALAGCGGDDDGDDGQDGGGAASLLPPPRTPSAADCRAKGLETSERPDRLAPAAGTYTYDVDGRSESIGETRRTSRLPERATLVVTRPARIGRLLCFKVQRRFSPELADETTFVVRGGDVLVTALAFQSGGQVTQVQPRPAILSFDGGATEWSGSFAGATRGSYRASVGERREMRVGGDRVIAAPIESQVSFGGEVRGTDRSTRWGSERDNTLIEERVVQERTFGLDRLRLTYTARLRDSRPSGGG